MKIQIMTRASPGLLHKIERTCFGHSGETFPCANQQFGSIQHIFKNMQHVSGPVLPIGDTTANNMTLPPSRQRQTWRGISVTQREMMLIPTRKKLTWKQKWKFGKREHSCF